MLDFIVTLFFSLMMQNILLSSFIYKVLGFFSWTKISAGFYCLNLIGCYISRVETLGAIKQSNSVTCLCLSSQDLDFSQLQSLSLLCVRVWDFPEVFFVLLYMVGFYYWPLLFKILLTIESFENKLYKVDIIWLNFNFLLNFSEKY